MNILGVHIDDKLSWNLHGDFLAKRLCKSVYLLRRLSCTVERRVLRMAYFAVFHSILSYCVLVWGHASVARRMFALQRRAIRIVGGVGYRDECRPLFINLGIMTLPALYIYRSMQYVRKHHSAFHQHQFMHDHDTRHKEDIRYPFRRLYKSRNSMNYWGLKFYNCLPSFIRQLPENVFDKRVRNFLLQDAPYDFKIFDRIALIDAI